MQQATQSALAAAGLPADYQTCPCLISPTSLRKRKPRKASQLLDSIFAQVAASASTFLSADELNKFQEFRTNAIKSSQAHAPREPKNDGAGFKMTDGCGFAS